MTISNKVQLQNEMIQNLKIQWKRLWSERLDDQWRGEGVANQEYSSLFIDKGTIIYASRNFKLPSLKEILKFHKIQNVDRYLPINPSTGGWAKFAKTHINKSKKLHNQQHLLVDPIIKKSNQQQKKSGRGWLHKRI